MHTPARLDATAADSTAIDASASAGASALFSRERLVAGALFAAALVLRVAFIFRYRYDSDEPQHLHTAWSWTQGWLQYRDFFDNHTPLFHIVMSPLVRLVGERPDILTFMRFAVVPLWLVSLACVVAIGTWLFSRRAGIWAAIGVALFPGFFFCSVEFRTDNLWTPLWLVTVAVAVRGVMTWRRGLAAGVLLGLCFMVSMKSTLLLAVSASAAVLALALTRGRTAEWKRLAITSLAALGGLILAPAATALFFAAQGAWEPFVYGTIRHNILAGVDEHNKSPHAWLLFPVLAPVLLVVARWIGRQSPDTALNRRRIFVFLACGLYIVMLDSFWTLLTRQDYLPYFPLAAIVLSPVVLFLFSKVRRCPSAWLLGGAGLVEILFLLFGRPITIDGTAEEKQLIREALRLTRPGETVLDFKGEAIFRPRAFYYVLEPLTFVRLRRELIADDIPERLVAARTCLALTADRWFPVRAREFLDENYLPIGIWRVPGRWLAAKDDAPGQRLRFELPIAGRYAVVAEEGAVHGVLDGTFYTGPRELAAGPHKFINRGESAKLALIWSRAIEAGFSPFPPVKSVEK